MSLLRGLESVWIRKQLLLAELTRISPPDVTDALKRLERRGVLQRSGSRGEARLYTFLPNAEIIEPEARVPAATVARCLAEIESDNVHGPGLEPGGQVRAVGLEPAEQRLACDLAHASRETAVQPDETGFVPWSQEWVRVKSAESMQNATVKKAHEMGETPTRMGESPIGEMGESPIRGGAEPRGGAHAAETLTFTKENDHVDVAVVFPKTMTKQRPVIVRLPSAHKQEMSSRALRAVWAVVPKGEFEPWQRRWQERCEAEPELVLGFAEDCSDRLKRGEKIPIPGAWIYRCVGEICEREGKPWR